MNIFSPASIAVMIFLLVIALVAIVGLIFFIRSILEQRKYERTNLPEIFEVETPEVEPETVFDLSVPEGEEVFDPELKKLMKESGIKTSAQPRRAIINPFKK